VYSVLGLTITQDNKAVFGGVTAVIVANVVSASGWGFGRGVLRETAGGAVGVVSTCVFLF
jgi:hypothetical protein